jgi:sigma-B regulation protein RsbU (phosphoserine phosphatase)
VTKIGGESWAAIVADVCGKGVSSALLASLIQGAFLSLPASPEAIESMLTSMNRFLLERTEGEKYATLFYCVLRRDGTLLWANAAHCAPVVVRAGGDLEFLEPTGMAVGMLDFASYGVESFQLHPGDKVLLYSDGVTDASNAAGEVFGNKRVRQTAREGASAGCKELHDTLRTAVREFSGGNEPGDDITALVVEYRPE